MLEIRYRRPVQVGDRMIYRARYDTEASNITTPGQAMPADSLFVEKDGFPIFDEHREVDGRGNVVAEYTAKDLQEICDACNKRVRDTGDPSPIVLGHTVEGAPETEQPPVVGFAKDFRLGKLKNGRAAILCRALFYKHKYKGGELLLDYPRRSIELWTQDRVIDPISLLSSTTPERDLGLPDIIRLSKTGEKSFFQAAYHDHAPLPGPSAGSGAGAWADKNMRPTDKPEMQELIASLMETDLFRWLRSQMEKEQQKQAESALARDQERMNQQQGGTQGGQGPGAQPGQQPAPGPPGQTPPPGSPGGAPQASAAPAAPPPGGNPAMPEKNSKDVQGLPTDPAYTREGSTAASVKNPTTQDGREPINPTGGENQTTPYDATANPKGGKMDVPDPSTKSEKAPQAGNGTVAAKHCASCGSHRKYWSGDARSEDPSGDKGMDTSDPGSPPADVSDPSNPSDPSKPKKHAASEPSGGNAFAPGPEKTRHSRDSHMNDDINTLKEEIKLLKERLDKSEAFKATVEEEYRKERYARVTTDRRHQLERLQQDEHILMDVDEEMNLWGANPKVDDDQWTNHLEHAVKKYARQRPGGGGPPIIPDRGPMKTAGGGVAPTTDNLRGIAALATKKGISFGEAMQEFSGKNGSV